MKLSYMLIILALFTTFCMCGNKEDWKRRTVYQVLTDRIWRDDGSTTACPDLGQYCGGTWKGIKTQLGYIQGMGFDAIWISPVVKNVETPYNYHGYSALNFNELNEHFGTEQDFVDLVTEIHTRGMWIMVDVVANHVGPVDLDFSTIVPFNLPEYYHDDFQINPEDWGQNQWRVENCRLANLPDLAQENSFVRQFLLNWVQNLVQKYKIDGLRIDTVPEVPQDFWKEFATSAGVYTVGECYDGRPDYVASYQGKLDGLFNYPLFFKQNDVYVWGNTMYGLRDILQ
jgi:alpha-amylase